MPPRKGTPGSGPKIVYSAKGVFHFEEECGEIFLFGPFSGHTVEEIKAEVPGELRVAEDLVEFPPPTRKKVDLIREFAPEIAAGRRLRLERSFPRILQALNMWRTWRYGNYNIYTTTGV